MATYYKPQSPIQSGEDFIYPITTADQVMVDEDTRLNAVGVYLENIDNSTDTTVYGNNATTLGGVAAEDYALKTDTAPDSSKLGGKAPEYYLQPRNLLDNSDFTNPVNQRGYTTTENNFIVDRWYTFNDHQSGGAALTSSGITLSGNGYLQQRLPKGILQTDKPYTLAVHYSDGTADVGTNGVTIFGEDFDFVNNVYANGKTISHVALYEGSYTAETLPEYQPKGYAVELAECQRYFRLLKIGGAVNGNYIGYRIPLSPAMRTNPSTTGININTTSGPATITAGGHSAESDCFRVDVYIGSDADKWWACDVELSADL